MTALTITILKILAVILILAAMIVILLGINHLFSGNFNSTPEDSKKLKEEIRHEDTVISDRNVFHNFIAAMDGKKEKKS